MPENSELFGLNLLRSWWGLPDAKSFHLQNNRREPLEVAGGIRLTRHRWYTLRIVYEAFIEGRILLDEQDIPLTSSQQKQIRKLALLARQLRDASSQLDADLAKRISRALPSDEGNLSATLAQVLELELAAERIRLQAPRARRGQSRSGSDTRFLLCIKAIFEASAPKNGARRNVSFSGFMKELVDRDPRIRPRLVSAENALQIAKRGTKIDFDTSFVMRMCRDDETIFH